MSESSKIKCRIPLSWQAELEAIANQTGQGVDRVIYQAIAEYLGKTEVSASSLQGMQHRLATVETQVSKADEAVMQVMMLSTRLVAVEQALASLSVSKGPAPLVIPEDDDIEDEPDEIMMSFLESEDFQTRAQQAIRPSPAHRELSQPLTYEDFENEPDEILYDFLEP